ncbi:MAG: 16S rRNA (cytosine(1402)-N(4))-methyltransferase [Candidatus Peribacteria bacterium]|jgi:16S rRNA C1402 N4-methylase RsmH|nr:16S rRNA (cytosine(1402)-N(4))-methyltransferase [Candidatus Peribacteria bacterium]
MIRHQPVLAKEIYEHLPKNLSLYFDGTFGHGGHVEYILSQPPFIPRLPQDCGTGKGAVRRTRDFGGRGNFIPPKIIACDLDPIIMQKGLEFTKQRTSDITPITSSYANIDQI